MSRNDFFDIEDRIRNAVDSAFRYVDDYENIKHTALNEVRNHLKRGTEFAQDTFDIINKRYKEQSCSRNRHNINVNNNTRQKYPVSLYVSPKPAGRISNILFSIFGGLGSVSSGIVVFIMLMIVFGSTDIHVRNVCKALSIGFSIAFIFSLSLSFIGSNIRKRLRRFKKYATYIGDKKYCKIESLALSIGESSKFVVKDLQRMIRLDMFREAHIDEENTYLMLGNQVYEDYLYAKESFNKRKEEEKLKKEQKNDTSEISTVIRMGRDYISQIRSANDAIPGEVISAKLDKLEKIVKAIFFNIEKNEKKVPDVKKFLNHYLPMTLKLVNSYKELDSQVIQGGNIRKAKLEIEKSIDLINTAFEKLLDDLFADIAMDVSSDISVLETLFSQEGLTEDELKKKK